MSYRKALERLEAYAPRKLIAGGYTRNGQHCAVGACEPRAPLMYTMYDVAESLGMTEREIGNLIAENDEAPFQSGPSPGRYQMVLAWLRERVAEEALG